MKRFSPCLWRAAVAAASACALFSPAVVRAHCDAMDGPVVKAAQQALAKGDVTPVLTWVEKDNEAEIRRAFVQAIAVRRLNDQARDLADRYFFETLVRLHRAGEKAPYTGLKPAGHVAPGIAAADAALESGNPDKLVKLIAKDVEEGLRMQFKAAADKRRYAPDDVAAGREFVKAYVGFTHFVEGVHAAAQTDHSAHGEKKVEPLAEHREHGK